MRRRELLGGMAAGSLLGGAPVANATARRAIRRVRPGDHAWPTGAQWHALGREVGGNLVQPASLYGACAADTEAAACIELLPHLRNPFYIGDQPGGTQV